MAHTTHDKSERRYEVEEYRDELEWQRRQGWLWPVAAGSSRPAAWIIGLAVATDVTDVATENRCVWDGSRRWDPRPPGGAGWTVNYFKGSYGSGGDRHARHMRGKVVTTAITTPTQ